MKVGDRVKVEKNDETSRQNLAGRYGYIVNLVELEVVYFDQSPIEVFAQVEFNDFTATIRADHLKVVG